MKSNAPAETVATVPLPIRTGLCDDCQVLTTSTCPSCLRPLCEWCSRGNDCSDPVCYECHRLRCTDYYCGKIKESA